jgi:hypothetical protein
MEYWKRLSAVGTRFRPLGQTLHDGAKRRNFVERAVAGAAKGENPRLLSGKQASERHTTFLYFCKRSRAAADFRA